MLETVPKGKSICKFMMCWVKQDCLFGVNHHTDNENQASQPLPTSYGQWKGLHMISASLRSPDTRRLAPNLSWSSPIYTAIPMLVLRNWKKNRVGFLLGAQLFDVFSYFQFKKASLHNGKRMNSCTCNFLPMISSL